MQELNPVIVIKEYIDEKDYKEINELNEIITQKDKVNLKLELDYKLYISKNSKMPTKKINEILYYVDDVLVSYLGISSFGRNIAEINGMTHPEWRRKGIFKKLFEIAMDEAKKRNFKQILLLADAKSDSGIECIKALGGEYDLSEYRMELLSDKSSEKAYSVELRKAEEADKREIARQNSIYFGDEEETDKGEEQNEPMIEDSYMIQLNNEVIGKINIECANNPAFIGGFGILPEFRGKGYGKAALKEAIKLIKEKNIKKIELDVSCKNDKALNLYKSCGFEEKSEMSYFIYHMKIN